MPLPRHDEQPLPSRRALRQAERARAAASSGAPQPVAAPRAAEQPRPASSRVHHDVAPRRARRRPAATTVTTVPPAAQVPRAVQVPPAAPAVEAVISDHVLEGGDDVWVDDVAPRPTPVGSRVVHEAPVTPVRAHGRGSAWRRLPQLVVVGSLVAATAGYAATGDISATAGAVPQFVREETVVSAEDATVVAATALPEDVPSDLVAGEDGLLRVREDDQASRADRDVLPGCDGVPPEEPVSNGRMDEQYLCTLWDGRTRIRADAAVSLALLNQAYRAEFDRDICMTDGYRSYAAQVSVRNRKPGLAAKPGTSEHGFGLAVDLCGGVESAGEAYWWLRDHAAQFGFENPAWAQRGGGGPYEPWHWEYTAGQW